MTTTYFTRGLDSIRIDTASANITTAKRVRDMVHEDYDFRYAHTRGGHTMRLFKNAWLELCRAVGWIRFLVTLSRGGK